MSVTIFMYHDIRNNECDKFVNRYKLKPFLTVNEFKIQLDYITSNYEVINTSKILNIKDDKEYAVLTFDDGLVDHYHILSILKEYNIKCTFFIPVGIILDNVVMKTHKVQFILSNTDEKELVKEILEFVDDKEIVWQKYSKSKFKNNWWTPEMTFITNFLRDYDPDISNCVTDKLFNKYVTSDEKTFSKEFYLNETQINEMINDGMEFGGHGFYSNNLEYLSLSEQQWDIENTIKYIKNLNQECDLVFSYPNGGVNDNIVEILKNQNCKIAYTTESVIVEKLDDVNFLKFPRISAPEKLNR